MPESKMLRDQMWWKRLRFSDSTPVNAGPHPGVEPIDQGEYNRLQWTHRAVKMGFSICKPESNLQKLTDRTTNMYSIMYKFLPWGFVCRPNRRPRPKAKARSEFVTILKWNVGRIKFRRTVCSNRHGHHPFWPPFPDKPCLYDSNNDDECYPSRSEE